MASTLIETPGYNIDDTRRHRAEKSLLQREGTLCGTFRATNVEVGMDSRRTVLSRLPEDRSASRRQRLGRIEAGRGLDLQPHHARRLTAGLRGAPPADRDRPLRDRHLFSRPFEGQVEYAPDPHGAENLHAEDRDRPDRIAGEDLGELFDLLLDLAVQLRAEDDQDPSCEEGPTEVGIRGRDTLGRDEQVGVVEVTSR
jgi:hypothetical protein